MKKEGGRKRLRILPNSSKGLSAIVATLIIILLVLVAAGIIWVVVRNIIAEGAEGIELGRFTLDLSIKSAYIDGTNINVNVRRSSGEGDLIGVRFIFFDGTDSTSVDRNIPLIPTQERLFSFNSDDFDGVDDISVFYEVSVAPIYTSSSGTETIGDITDTATISGSSGGNGDNGGTGTSECDDGTDNDDDGNIDLNDIGCLDSNDNDETDCGDGVCEGGENVDTCPLDCSGGTPSSCNGIWDGDDVGVNDCDGDPLPANCNPDCTCSAGFSGDGAGACVLDPSINNGTIYSVWPSGAVKYFDSEDLPIDVTDYTSYYVNFSGSAENGCFRITWAEYLDTNGRSYIRTEFIVDINSGETYHVWEAENCGA